MDLLKNLRSELQQVLESVKPQIQMPQQKEVELTKGFKGDVLVDTNVLMNGILKENYVLCSNVLEELERHKAGFTDKARNSRATLRWALNHPDNCVLGLKVGSLEDDNIIATAKAYKLPLMTGDVAMATKARCQGIKVIFQEGEEKKEEVDISHLNYGEGVETKEVWGLSPMNDEQGKLISLLMNKENDLVSIIGKSGSGKSIVALACALELLEDKDYNKVVIMRKEVSVADNNQIGFLPGSKEDKSLPFLGGLMDALEFLAGGKKAAEGIMDAGMIEIENLSFLRGRSIANAIIIIDESQNLSTIEIKTVLTRASKNCKIFLTGDVNQIDIKGLSPENNGLSLAAHLFKDWEHAASIVLKTVVRSRLAEKAEEVFNG